MIVRGPRGSAAVELVLVAPLLVVLIGVVVFLGRIAQARSDVDLVVRDAARAASLARSPEQATADATTSARKDALSTGLCESLDVAVDTTRFAPGGHVVVNLSCRIATADLVGLWIAPRPMIMSSFTESVDLYRGYLR